MFTRKLVNRMNWPIKHILVCEDGLLNQKKIVVHLSGMFPDDGPVQISYVPGGLYAGAILSTGVKINLIILDKDMPDGDGVELINLLKEHSVDIPIITFSSIEYNNTEMYKLGATYKFSKLDVINGLADSIIYECLGIKIPHNSSN